eukprot:TRINITY_DN22088_c0_g1_i1.p1 TRINITY_DN22088_c0_g1~~TRINITY_DN22088_c0_g1_i1.p1  ORF type:complete len:353 (+),score=69.20 TRINITY_DN22088_c0_g1_i1:86-1060(+)
MTYAQAMENYGSDKPDIRFENTIQNVSSIFKAPTGLDYLDDISTEEDFYVQAIVFGDDDSRNKMKVPSSQTLKKIMAKALERYPPNKSILSSFTSDGSLRGSMINKCHKDISNALIETLSIKTDDFGFIFAGGRDLGREVLGLLRLELGSLFYDLSQKKDFKFLWVQDFPLFMRSDEKEGAFESAHHPFTQPHPEDTHLLGSQPLEVRSLHYDLVLNGSEIGGGSIRIHDSALQRSVLEDFLKEDSIKELSHLLEALDHGCPPHGGIALGLDRYVAMLSGAKSIRDVIAFPKASNGRDLMCDSPTELSAAEKELYKIDTKSEVD